MPLRRLIQEVGGDESDEFKAGWEEAICHVNDRYVITERDGEPIGITFEVNLTDDVIQKIADKVGGNEQASEK